MREGTISKNWKDILQRISQSGALENIDLKDTWFTPDLEKDPSKTPTHMPRVAPENNRNMITSSHPIQQVQESTASKIASDYEVPPTT